MGCGGNASFFCHQRSCIRARQVRSRAGGIAVVKRGISKDTVKDARADHGTVVVSDDGSGSALILAPANARDLDDTVTHKIGDVQQPPIEVSVRPHAPKLDSPKIYGASFKALFVLFVLAVLVENGLALVFRRRPYLDFLDTAPRTS
jgi:hypothetical protein